MNQPVVYYAKYGMTYTRNTRDGVLKDWPRLLGQFEDKNGGLGLEKVWSGLGLDALPSTSKNVRCTPCSKFLVFV